VIGRRRSAVSEAEALEYVFGFTACNDVSARDIQFRAGAGTTELGLSKNLDTFCPLGPVIVTADEIENPQALLVSSELNGQAMQTALTSTMIRPVNELISYISRFITLEPGDVLLTGTPAGTGAFREPPIFLQDGDVVSVAVEGIGRLTNRCQVRMP
jgi:2,4-didehydro-3-deoxy-L-rhamnonate hydrolase